MSLPGFTAESAIYRQAGTYRTSLTGRALPKMPRVTAQLHVPDVNQGQAAQLPPILQGVRKRVIFPQPVFKGGSDGFPWQECGSCTCQTPFGDVVGVIDCCAPPFAFSLACGEWMQTRCHEIGGSACFPIYI